MYCFSCRNDGWWQERNILPSDAKVSVKKEDFVMITKNEKTGKIAKVKKVDHDDVPHGLMTQIHDMGHMHM